MHILIADDHNLVRESLKLYIEKLSPTTQISEANDFTSAENLAAETSSLDIILLDLVMPGMDGLSGIGRMSKKFPESRVVLLSGTPLDSGVVNNALKQGAKGFIPKSIEGHELVAALDKIKGGGTFVPKEFTRKEERRKSGKKEGPLDSFPNFTKRESHVLEKLLLGMQNREIAEALGITEITVKIHMSSIFKKFGVENRTQAFRKAMELGW